MWNINSDKSLKPEEKFEHEDILHKSQCRRVEAGLPEVKKLVNLDIFKISMVWRCIRVSERVAKIGSPFLKVIFEHVQLYVQTHVLMN